MRLDELHVAAHQRLDDARTGGRPDVGVEDLHLHVAAVLGGLDSPVGGGVGGVLLGSGVIQSHTW